MMTDDMIVQASNRDFLIDFVRGSFGLPSELIFQCHLLNSQYHPSINPNGLWSVAQKYSSCEKSIKTHIIPEFIDWAGFWELRVPRYKFKWKNNSIEAKFLIIRHEDKIIYTLNFMKKEQTIKGNFMINVDSNILIKLEV